MAVDLIWKLAGSLLILIGVVFAVLPGLPGQVIAWFALLALQFTSSPPFSQDFLLRWAFITLVVTLLDYYVPIWGTKKFGGSRRGVWGATIGLIFGIFFFPPFGMIAGPFIGAYIGELSAGKESGSALKAAFGAFVGFVAGTLMKLAITIIMGYHFFRAVFFF